MFPYSVLYCAVCLLGLFFFFNDTATTEIYTLSLHDALPIFRDPARRGKRGDGERQQAVARVAELAEAPDAIPHRGQDERRRTHGAPAEQVEQEARGETGGAARHRACVVGERRDREHDHVELAAEDAEAAERRELEDHGEQEQQTSSDERAGRDDHGVITPAVCAPVGRRVRTCTMSSFFRSANGRMCTRW